MGTGLKSKLGERITNQDGGLTRWHGEEPESCPGRWLWLPVHRGALGMRGQEGERQGWPGGGGGRPGGPGESSPAQVPARDFWRQRDLGLRLGSCYNVTVSKGCKEMEKGLG